MHYQLSVFAKLILPPSPASKETLIWRFWPLQELPKCIWHSVEHLVCTVIFGKLSGLHCGLELLTYPPCPLSVLLPLPPSCAVPAPPSSSRARCHFVEQVPCVLWARPERTFCTRAHRAAASHCRPRRVPHMALASLQRRELASPTLHATPGALQRSWQSFWRHAGVGSGLCHVRHRPNCASAPAAPGNRSCLSSCLSERARRRHVALQLQHGCRRRSYPRPPRDQPRTPIKGDPEPLRALRRPQAFPQELPEQ